MSEPTKKKYLKIHIVDQDGTLLDQMDTADWDLTRTVACNLFMSELRDMILMENNRLQKGEN